MRFKYILLLIILVITGLIYSCNQQKSKKSATAEEMITAKTLGLAYLEDNQLENAETESLKLIDYNPDEVLGYANLRLVYLRMGKYQEAGGWLKDAIEMDPKDPQIRLITP
ncbi:MAG: hypothetical protein K8R53_00965, partial [Bacteroidales bacterium]|nr:hypothetical protein [Bacteroidales bacterium]